MLQSRTCYPSSLHYIMPNHKPKREKEIKIRDGWRKKWKCAFKILKNHPRLSHTISTTWILYTWTHEIFHNCPIHGFQIPLHISNQIYVIKFTSFMSNISTTVNHIFLKASPDLHTLHSLPILVDLSLECFQWLLRIFIQISNLLWQTLESKFPEKSWNQILQKIVFHLDKNSHLILWNT